MINLAADVAGNPVAAWLQGLSLVLAESDNGGESFTTHIIDTEVCDCCRPQMVAGSDQLFVAFRNSEYDSDGKNIRDVHVGWIDAGGEFTAARVADGHWYLNACPISGPSLTSHDGALFAAWMDGRNDESGHMERTDIWFAKSSDGGVTFSPNVQISSEDDSYRKIAAIEADADANAAGRIHIVWVEESGLYYAGSADGGATFSAPQSIVAAEDGIRPDNPMLASAGENLYLVWTDRSGAHLAILTESGS
jgi:hypothetical protein